MSMHDGGPFVGKELSEPGDGEGVPRGRQRPADDPGQPVVTDFVTVSGKLDNLMAVLPQQGSFRPIDGILAAGGRRAVEIVDEKDFHWRLAFLAVNNRKRPIKIDRVI